ncbi:DUF2149 domain-containing protein [Sphingobacterium chuzhouense]|uniref:DUF2149 domain-containing protein n=1 Tax=Sphingobacterium chuzhouense TaxID=1742264 RepID=A0ABR7XQD0_9SPHI|nr:DUF2149 domain-containing protein [Sphingobacterium chuzhouense]MBD1421389.1 DUF2149 domain-containing protein [Sphingobacterium chuzhouense]
MRNKRRKRRFRRTDDEALDPIAAVANLFDFSLVFAVALMVALVTRYGMSEILSQEDFSMIKNPGKDNMEIITKKGDKVEKYRADSNEEAGGSKGKKIGTAYQLDNGEIIYIPD